MPTETIILTINTGSSSVKYNVYNWTTKSVIASGVVERIGMGHSFIKHSVPHRPVFRLEESCPDHTSALTLLVKALTDDDVGVLTDISLINAVGHRVVHGGEKFVKSVKIDGPNGEVLKTLKALSPLAPLHNPVNIIGIEAAMHMLPDVPHIAVMDTAFHQTLPEHAYFYALPFDWYTKYHVRRYGFHGTSHLYVSKRAAVMLGKSPFDVNLITCHIGNGVSFTAVKNGVSVDHSMGFTPLEGLVMGTRCGDIDPAIIPFICNKEQISVRQCETILNKESGIKGITGKFVDRRDVLEAAKNGNKRAQLAIDIESYHIKKYIGAYSAALGHVDAVVFTAGVGELAYPIREKALTDLENIGIILDKERNTKAVSRYHESVISTNDSPVKIFVIPTDEELVFVEDVVAILENRYDIHTNFSYSFESPDYINTMREEAYNKEQKERSIH